MGPLIETGFDQALGGGMDTGLRAAQLHNTLLYHNAELQNQLARTSLYAQGLENRASQAEAHNQFLYNKLAETATHNRASEDLGQGRIDQQGAWHGGLLDLRSRAQTFKEDQAGQKQSALDAGSLYQFGQMHPPLSDDQQGPPEDTSDPMAQWQSMDPQTRAREYHHWQGQQDKQAVIDHEHERAEKTIQGITADQGMSPDQKHAAIQTIRAKAAKLGLPSWIFRPKSATDRSSTSERTIANSTDDQLRDTIAKGKQNNIVMTGVSPMLAMQAQNEINRRSGAAVAPQPQPSAVAPAGVAPPSPAAPAPVVAPPPAAPPQIDPGLIDQIEKDLPGASDEQIAAEYRRRTGGH